MGILSQVGRFIGNIFDLIASVIAGLIYVAIWAVGAVIELATDILGWINNELEELLNGGATEVNVIRGNALADYVSRQKQSGNYTEISISDLNAMRNSVVNVAMDPEGNIIDDQMIRSQSGLSAQTKAQFKGQPILKVNIA